MHILSDVVFARWSIGYPCLLMYYLPGRVFDAYTQWCNSLPGGVLDIYT